MIHEEFLWVEKYRPKTVEETVLPKSIKKILQGFVDQKDIPTLLLSGTPGVGKTTVAKAMLDELGCDYIMINGSLEGRLIDTLRIRIEPFASTVSFNGKRKYVIIDEADYMNRSSVQPALRNFIEHYSDNCGFILTCNSKNRLISALHSRNPVIEFKIPSEEREDIAKQFFKRGCQVLEAENVEYDKAALAAVIKKFFPDFRRIIGELQNYASIEKKIDTGILTNLSDINLDNLVRLLKEKDFTNLRRWVTENADIDPVELFTSFFDHAEKYLKSKSDCAVLVLLLGKYQYQSAFALNQEINTMSFLVDVMTECNFE